MAMLMALTFMVGVVAVWDVGCRQPFCNVRAAPGRSNQPKWDVSRCNLGDALNHAPSGEPARRLCA